MTVVNIHTRLQATWDAYLAAKDRANETRTLEDALAAGRAWRAWLDHFMTPEQREALSQNIGAMR